ncbi:MAG TPA: three-Cys-motif partner protein TcmP [Chthoniobacterales bacterium]|jgi:three-Cys-motif partner protein
MPNQSFGGDWTEQKLKILDNYLTAYCRIFRENERAKFFKTIYVDAFAGTGAIHQVAELGGDESAIRLLEGSAARAIRHSFDQFLFIEKSAKRVAELEALKSSAPAPDRISICHGDANEKLLSFIRSIDWKTHRAVVFLDPYGMQVDWETIRTLGQTKAVDLWFLFPLGQAVMRLLTRDSEPPSEWRSCLDRVFGTTSWKEEFYITWIQPELFGGEEITTRRHADWRRVKRFLVERLRSAFCEAHPKPGVLRNSNNVPIYLFCFAAANPIGAKTALKIADCLLKPFDT